MAPSAHLLRTLAAVAPGARILDAACGDGRHLVPLAQLGFDVWGATDSDPAAARARLGEVVGHDEARRRIAEGSPDALGHADAWAHWVVLSLDGQDAAASLAEAARVVQPGGWVWVEMASRLTEAVEIAAGSAGLVVSEPVGADGDRAHGIFRRPGAVE